MLRVSFVCFIEDEIVGGHLYV